jgi:hypothetical protein
MTATAARAELIRCAGTQFDPDVVRAFLNLSIGSLNRWAGPLAWLAQLSMVRPGATLGPALGAAAGATAATVSVVSLSLAPIAVGEDGVTGRNRGSSIGNAPTSSPTAGPTPTSTTPGQPTPTRAPTTTTPVTATSTGPPPTSPITITSTPSVPATGGIDLVDDTINGLEDVAKTVDLLANDVVEEGKSLTLVSVAGALHGTVVMASDRTIRYTPDPNFHGEDTVHYTVSDGHGAHASATATIRVGSVNDPPITAATAYSTSTAVRLVVDAAHGVLAQATDIDGDTLKVISDSSPTVTIRADGSLTFTPLLPTTMTVDYVVSDGTTTSTGTVTIGVSLFGRASSRVSPVLCSTCRWVGIPAAQY